MIQFYLWLNYQKTNFNNKNNTL